MKNVFCFNILPLKIREDVKSVIREVEHLTKIPKENIKGLKLKNNKIVTVELIDLQGKTEEEIKEQLRKGKKIKCIFFDKKKSKEERLNQQVTPLYNVSYLKQIEMKQKKIKNILNGMLIPSTFLKEPVLSPITEGYRNKIEFSIGFDEEENSIVGFSLGLYKEGIISLCQPTDCIHIPKVSKEIAFYLQKYIQENKYKPYNRESKKGLWRILSIRIHTEGILCGLQLNQSELDQKELKEIEQKVSDYLIGLNLKDENNKKIQVKGVLVQYSESEFNGLSQEPFRLIRGVECVYEKLLGCLFYVSIDSFFQTNRFCIDKLYKTIKEQAIFGSKNKLLLDLCCGTGTIGIVLSDWFENVIGIDLCKSSIDMAKKNSFNSNKKNISFVLGSIESELNNILSNLKEETVVVLDPPRAGTTKKVINLLKKTKQIKRIIYVSCSLENSQQNIFDLISNKENNCFKVNESILVDMFPHTKHVEVVTRLDR